MDLLIIFKNQIKLNNTFACSKIIEYLCGSLKNSLTKHRCMNPQKFEQEFLTRYPDRKQILTYIHTALGISVVEWEHLTKVNLNTIAKYVRTKVSVNSAVTYMAILKSFLNRYSEEGIIPCRSFRQELTLRRVPSQHIALTMEEIIMFDNYEPKTQTERDVKILFMRGCLTGMRLSDAMLLTEDNIRGGILSYVSQKTRTEVHQPVQARLMKYIESKPRKEHQRSVVNRVIQSICKDLGLTDEVQLFVNGRLRKGAKYKFVSMHTSRRSYVSCLAANGVPIATISKLAGHGSTTMTDRYVCIDVANLGKEAMLFFNT